MSPMVAETAPQRSTIGRGSCDGRRRRVTLRWSRRRAGATLGDAALSLLLVPHEVGPNHVQLWVGALDEPAVAPASLSVTVRAGTAPAATADVGTWQGSVTGRGRSIAFRRVTITGLTPRTRYRCELLRDGVVVPDATAFASTLPVDLPTIEERSFTVLLGSCFSQGADGAGNAGRAFSLLPADLRPEIKILCGDQVYLDQPTMEFLFHTHDEDDLRGRHLSNYAKAWAQAGGFRELLRDGGTWFSSDDHDFWNNAPNATVIARDTWSVDGRGKWMRAATALYEAFQRPAGRSSQFRVGRLSFFVADTRIGRSEATAGFASEPDLQDIETWAAALDGPGCLVLGQLLFSGQSGIKGKFMDYGLPDFVQYPRLVRALMAAGHTVVILTGDVHFGRVAVCQIEPGRDVVEIVASPLALVAKVPANTWHEAPPEFPAVAIPGMARRPVQTAEAFRLNANHFATIGFDRSGAFVRMRIRAWPVETNGRLPTPSHEFTYEIR
jgi:hypothetical protein